MQFDNMVLIYIQSSNGEKRFFNRKTQGFTARLRHPDYLLSFFDTRESAVVPCFASFREHKPSYLMWLAMANNDSTLVYHKTTVGELRKTQGLI